MRPKTMAMFSLLLFSLSLQSLMYILSLTETESGGSEADV